MAVTPPKTKKPRKRAGIERAKKIRAQVDSTLPPEKLQHKRRQPNPPPAVELPPPGIGRPQDYKDEYAEVTRRLCLLGMDDNELAVFFGVSPDTISEWAKTHAAFSEARARAREWADAEVAESLYKRALGYSHPDSHVSNYQGDITVTPLVRHYPPDTQAASWWLKNRRGDKWQDKQNIDHSGSVGLGVIAVPAKEPPRG